MSAACAVFVPSVALANSIGLYLSPPGEMTFNPAHLPGASFDVEDFEGIGIDLECEPCGPNGVVDWTDSPNNLPIGKGDWANPPDGYISSIGLYVQDEPEDEVARLSVDTGIFADNQYGAGTGDFLAVAASRRVTLTFNEPQKYFGFAWPAGDTHNFLEVRSGGSVLFTISTADVVQILPNNPNTTVTALDGNVYNTIDYYGKPGTEHPVTGQRVTDHEPYAFLHFFVSGDVSFDEIVFIQGPAAGFETDNHTIITAGMPDEVPENPWVSVLEFTVPEAVDDQSLDNPRGTPVTVDVLANDELGLDPNGNPVALDPATVIITGSIPPGGILAPDGKSLEVPGEGLWEVNPTTGAITFTPEVGFVGDPTPIQYRVSDDRPVVSNFATVIITYVHPLAINKTADVTSGLSGGETITYTVTITNLGGVQQTGVTVEDILPPGTTFVEGSLSAEVDPPLSGGDPETDTVTATGSGTFTVPAGVTSLTVEAWGGGGGAGKPSTAGNDSGGGGGGGGYARGTFTVSPGDTINYFVGSGGGAAAAGQGSWFSSSTTLFAAGGGGGGVATSVGAGGSANIGNVATFAGGAGASGSASGPPGNRRGGGGGGSATVSANGTAGAAGGSNSGGGGGAGQGQGGNGTQGSTNGNVGQAPGGGGGGGGNGGVGGAGARGEIRITYTPAAINPGTIGDAPEIASNWTLDPGAVLTLTFEVTVDEPVEVEELTNTASTFSQENPDPVSDSVTSTFAPGSIAGTIFADTSGDGLGDAPQSGVTVTLLDSSGDPVLDGNGNPVVAVTDGDGNYSFTNLPPGNYRVAQTVPGGFTAIGAADGGDFTVIGDITPISVAPGQNITGRDFVNQQPGSISGTVLMDTTGDGVGDTPQSGVMVSLLDGSGDPVLDGNGDPVTMTTDGDGFYSFTNLPPGDYQVAQTVPESFVPVDDADGGDLTVIGDVTPISVVPGQSVTDLDFVNQQPGSISGFVLEDLTNNDLGDYPIAGVTLTLKDANGDDIDSDPETPGVQPTTTVTAADGSYSFDNLPPGSYMVVQTQPANYNSVSDADGGDPDVIGDVTLIVVAPGQPVMDQTFVERHQLGSLNGRVMVDNTGDDVGNYPLGGVTITLVDADGNPVDGDLLTPGIQPVTTVTDEDGYYSFTNVRVGTLGTRMTPVSTHYSHMDADGDDPTWIGDVAGIVVLEDTNTPDNDYLLRRLACPNTWESWLERWELEDPTPLGNEDGDLYSNLLEYAFCMNPKDGSGGAWCPDYVLETTGPGEFVIKVNANFGRTGAGPTDVIFELQYTDTLGPDTTWTTIPLPEPDGETVLLDTDFETGREVVEMVDLVGLTGLTEGQGFIRLKVTLDTNGNGIADPDEPSDVTEVGGWIITPLTPNIRTFNDPFVSCAVYSGTVASVDGFDLHLETSESAERDLSGDINYPAYHYYAEVLDGEFEGHRFDVIGGGETFLTVANDTDIFSAVPPHSTYAGAPPAGLAGARIVVRQYRTMDELFQTSTLVTQQPEDASWVDPALSPVVQMNRGGQWTSQWLLQNDDDVAWVEVGDEDLNDAGTMPMPPGQGAFIQARFTGVLVLLGKVRENDFRRPLQAGLNNVGSGYPVLESAAGRWMTRTQNGFRPSHDFQVADAFMMWRGDTQPGVHVYDNYFFANRVVDNPSYLRWVRSGDAFQGRRENELFFRPDHSILIRHNVGGAEPLNLPDYRWPAPWSP